MANAQAKRTRKNADWIVANDVSPETGIMGGAENAVHLITADGVEDWPRLAKDEVARRLAARIAAAWHEHPAASYPPPGWHGCAHPAAGAAGGAAPASGGVWHRVPRKKLRCRWMIWRGGCCCRGALGGRRGGWSTWWGGCRGAPPAASHSPSRDGGRWRRGERRSFRAVLWRGRGYVGLVFFCGVGPSPVLCVVWCALFGPGGRPVRAEGMRAWLNSRPACYSGLSGWCWACM